MTKFQHFQQLLQGIQFPELNTLKPAVYTAYNGMVEPGNINLFNRPKVQNPDGSVSTVRSLGINYGGKEFLIPTVRQGLDRVMSNEEAINHFYQTGEHLGVFDSTQASDNYAQLLHMQQQNLYK